MTLVEREGCTGKRSTACRPCNLFTVADICERHQSTLSAASAASACLYVNQK